MMGHRGQIAGEEYDAFSRKSRHILRWRPGMIARLKRTYGKRVRRAGREAAREVLRLGNS